MTIEEVYQLLQSTDYPVAYNAFRDDVDPPFLTYNVAFTSNFGADNHVHKIVNHINITLWTAKKDLTAEAKVETALSDLYWNKEETFLDEEEIYEIVYEVEIM